jgi:hypothetical protein
VLNKGFLNGMKLTRAAQSFNGQYLPIHHLHCWSQARINCLPINQHRAGTTFPPTAGFLGAGKTKLTSEDINKHRRRVNG